MPWDFFRPSQDLPEPAPPSDKSLKEVRQEYKTRSHYHGKVVRQLFFLAACIMLVTLPFFRDRIFMPVHFSVLLILILGLFAGLTNPLQPWIFFLDVCISFAGFVVFESYAIIGKPAFGIDGFFMVNQVLGLIFFGTFYLTTKTLIGFVFSNISNDKKS